MNISQSLVPYLDDILYVKEEKLYFLTPTRHLIELPSDVNTTTDIWQHLINVKFLKPSRKFYVTLGDGWGDIIPLLTTVYKYTTFFQWQPNHVSIIVNIQSSFKNIKTTMLRNAESTYDRILRVISLLKMDNFKIRFVENNTHAMCYFFLRKLQAPLSFLYQADPNDIRILRTRIINEYQNNKYLTERLPKDITLNKILNVFDHVTYDDDTNYVTERCVSYKYTLNPDYSFRDLRYIGIHPYENNLIAHTAAPLKKLPPIYIDQLKNLHSNYNFCELSYEKSLDENLEIAHNIDFYIGHASGFVHIMHVLGVPCITLHPTRATTDRAQKLLPNIYRRRCENYHSWIRSNHDPHYCKSILEMYDNFKEYKCYYDKEPFKETFRDQTSFVTAPFTYDP